MGAGFCSPEASTQTPTNIEKRKIAPVQIPATPKSLTPAGNLVEKVPKTEYQKDVVILCRFRAHNSNEQGPDANIIVAQFDVDEGKTVWEDVDTQTKWEELTKEHSMVAVQTPRTAAKGKERDYNYDRVFPPQMTNIQLYRIVRGQWITTLTRGTSLGIFGYGASMSGKSHTVLGSKKEPGLIEMVADDLLRYKSELPEDEGGISYDMNFFEIYLGCLRDLLDEKSKKVALKDLSNIPSPRTASYLPHGKSVQLQTPADLVKCLKSGRKKLNTELKNDRGVKWHSSRGTAVFVITITRTNQKGEEPETCKAIFVDFAGPLKLKDVENKSQKEALNMTKTVNAELLAFRKIVLFDATERHKPYRDAVVTHTLRDILPGGKGKTVLMLFCSDHIDHIRGSKETLRFGLDCSKVHRERPEESNLYPPENKGKKISNASSRSVTSK